MESGRIRYLLDYNYSLYLIYTKKILDQYNYTENFIIEPISPNNITHHKIRKIYN